MTASLLNLTALLATSVGAIPVPTPEQVAWHEAGVGLFFHWAPNSIKGIEGDDLSVPREQINPDRFDPAEFAKACRVAGAGYMIFVAKHIGGYCAWQTKTTDYALTSSPWKGGKGDMVAELAAACAKDKLHLGIYLSPRDDSHQIGNGGKAHDPAQQEAYNAVYRAQLSEILSNYGPMFEMWFDGGNIVPINDVIDRLAPGIISFQGRRSGGSRWVGTEHGFAPYPCWNAIAWQPGETPHEGAGTPDGNAWCPAECDVSLLRPRWFWYPGCERALLTLDQLIEIYYMSVGRGVNLLLNATPDPHGAIPADQMARLAEFGDEVRRRFAKPLATTHGQGDSLTLDLGGEQTIDHLVLREDIRGGERVRGFVVEGRRKDGKWLRLASGSQIAVRQIIPIPPERVDQVRLTVTQKVEPVTIAELSVLRVDRPVPAIAYREGGRQAMRAPKLSRSRDGVFAIDCPTPDWEIRYTLDGSEPTRASTLYHEPQQLALGGTLRARYFVIGEPDAPAGPVATRRFGLAQSRIKVLDASSSEPDARPELAFDGDPNTVWHTKWRGGNAQPPHWVTVDLGADYAVDGLAYLMRQDADGTRPSGVSVWVADSPEGLVGEPRFTGSLGDFKTDTYAWRQVEFGQAYTGRYVKIAYPGEIAGQVCVASAEIELLVRAGAK